MSQHKHGTMENLAMGSLMKLSEELNYSDKEKWKEVAPAYMLGYARGVMAVAHLMEWKEVFEAWKAQEQIVINRSRK